MNIGTIAYDKWTKQRVVIVAGAQAEGYVTIIIGSDVTSVRITDLVV